jgi:peptide chain release factor 2
MSEKELLFSVTAKDCKWDYFRGHGKGGQKRNKTSSAVRCTHIESGAVGTSQDERSQTKNKSAAFSRMASTDKFKKWIKLEASRKMGIEKQIEEAVNRSMDSKNIKVEIKENGKWKTDETVL